MELADLKKWLDINFILRFTTTKLLAYIVVFLSFGLSFSLNETSAFITGIGCATVLMGVKKVSDNNTLVKTQNNNNTPTE